MKFELNKVYRATDGTEWKVVCINVDSYTAFVNKESNDFLTYYEGEIGGHDLIELVGEDFTEIKEPREFKFEGVLIEYEGCPQEQFAISEALGKFCSYLYINEEYVKKISTGKISKWEVTMKEILK